MTNQTVTPLSKKRKRGRPRKDKSEKSARRNEIIDAALDLFSRQPYRDITMSDIARAAGINQSSLYYWFKSKEDLLEVILQESKISMIIAHVSIPKGEKPLHLYSVVYSDIVMMCELPFDYFDLEAAALGYPERLKTFFETYRNLRDSIAKIIQQGIEDGDFASDDASLSASIALSVTEGLQHQYHRARTTVGNADVDAWNQPFLDSKHAIARLAADSVLNILMDHPDVDALYEKALERNLIPER